MDNAKDLASVLKIVWPETALDQGDAQTITGVYSGALVGVLFFGTSEQTAQARDSDATGEILAAEITNPIGIFYRPQQEQQKISGRAEGETAPADQTGKGRNLKIYISGFAFQRTEPARQTGSGILSFYGRGMSLPAHARSAGEGLVANPRNGRGNGKSLSAQSAGYGRVITPEEDLLEILALLEEIA